MRSEKRTKDAFVFYFSCLLVVGCLFPTETRSAELRYDLRIDIPITAVGGVAWIGSELLKSHLAPIRCRWCDRQTDGTENLNHLDASVRSGLLWGKPDVSDTLSNVVGFGLAPLAAFGMIALAAGRAHTLVYWPIDALLLLEAVVVAADVNQIVKFTVGRERPFVHALPEEQKSLLSQASDNHTSFYSGHTNLVFALAVASGTLATLRGYRFAPWVWTTGLVLATLTGYLRIAADKHYFSDVLVGAALGSLIGFGVPYLFHARKNNQRVPSVALSPSLRGAFLSLNWYW